MDDIINKEGLHVIMPEELTGREGDMADCFRVTRA